MIESCKVNALSMKSLHCINFDMLCIPFGDHELLLRSEIKHEESERVNTRELTLIHLLRDKTEQVIKAFIMLFPVTAELLRITHGSEGCI